MIKNGIINGDLASLLARFRHVNTIAIVDGPFPTYPNVETIDLALVMGTPTVIQVLDAILPHLELTGMYLAAEFEAKMNAFQSNLNSLFAESKELENEIQKQLKGLKYE